MIEEYSLLLTERLIAPDNSPCSCYGKPTERVYLASSLDMVGWHCSACGHRWPVPWARERALNAREKARAFQKRQERG